MERHDEMKQLSLIPVNASLFAALLKGEDSTSINTLTMLYYELTLHMIRRELSRMGLQEYTQVSRISYLNEEILDCLYRLGFIAFLGVANRDLASEENVPLIMRQEEYTCQCLGLAHEHYRKKSIGLMKKVWTFDHLTMQEFVSALWLEHTTWTEQCYSVRYISNSMTNFSLFKMVVRFLCGLLSDKAAAALSIIYRYLTPQPIQLIDMPMSYQLKFDYSYHHQDWIEHIKTCFQLFAILFETISHLVSFWFNSLKKSFPTPLYLYIRQEVSPNEWACFIRSLPFVSQIQLIHIDTGYINPAQFNTLIQAIRMCSLNTLALRFSSKGYASIDSYTNKIIAPEMKFDTKISIEFVGCNLSNETGVNLNLFSTNLRLDNTIYSNQYLQHLSDQLSTLDNFFLYPPDSERFYRKHFDELLSAMCMAKQLKGLHLYDFPVKFHDNLLRALPQFLELQEVGLDDYSLLIPLVNLSRLTYLQVRDVNSEDKSIHVQLLDIISKNSHTLRGVKLYAFNTIGIESWSMFLDCLQLCKNLVQLELENIVLSSDDVTHWESGMCQMRSVVELKFYNISLYDTGILYLCTGLSCHPSIRLLSIVYCDNTSASCDALIYLIGTLSELEFLAMTDLSEPDNKSIKDLRSIAESYFIKHDLY